VPGRLDGKVCIITGAGSGIGRASAVLFAHEGARVIVADIDTEGAEETVRMIVAEGGAASAHTVDVTEPDQAQRLADQTAADHSRIDVLFNNAGIPGVGTAHETDVEDFDRVLRVNVRGVFLVAKYVLPHMIAQRSGSIINMSSAIATTGLANRVPYSASKGAVLSMTRSMQVDCGPLWRPRQRADAGHHLQPVRRALPARVLPDPRGRAGSHPQAPAGW
jgi:NAD(P)-dependent dehydrogenase (short-subunit alcohol dehydrogenase family)